MLVLYWLQTFISNLSRVNMTRVYKYQKAGVNSVCNKKVGVNSVCSNFNSSYSVTLNIKHQTISKHQKHISRQTFIKRKHLTKTNQMNFFQQYKDLFDLGNYPSIPNNRLRIDNQLFIDRPYIPTYTQEHSLNSKIRELKKDYNEFESQLKDLEELEDIPQRSQSRRKQNPQNNQQNRNNNSKRAPTVMDNSSKNIQGHIKNRSTIFDHYQQNQSHYIPQKQQRHQRSLPSNNSPSLPNQQQSFARNKYPQLPPSQSPFGHYQDNGSRNELNQKENKLSNSFKANNNSLAQNQQSEIQKQLLESLRKQNEDNTARMVKNQNSLKNKFYQQDTNNVLKQSQINHIFNWKLQKPSTFDKLDYLPQSPIPKYKIQTSVLQPRQRQPTNQNKNFTIRNVPSNNQLKPNNRNKIVPQQKEYNMPNKNSSAQERRRLARQNIDDRREKLKMVLKAFY